MKRALVIVDHGSRRPEANAALEEIAKQVQGLLPDVLVQFAHMEIAGPSIREAVDACVAQGATDITVHPYFLAPGNHSTQDIPRQVEEAIAAHPGLATRITEPLGPHPDLAQLVRKRVDESTS